MGAAKRAWIFCWRFLWTGFAISDPLKPLQLKLCKSIQSGSRLALVKHAVWLSSESTRASHPSRFQRTSMQGCNQKVSARNVTFVQLREFPGCSFLIWHRIPRGRTRRIEKETLFAFA